MVLYGFRSQTQDIDLGCSTFLADKLEQQGYAVLSCKDGTRKILYAEGVKIFENWIEDSVEVVGDIPIVSVDGLIQMKKRLGREKDLEDIALIERVRKINGIYFSRDPFLVEYPEEIRNETCRSRKKPVN